MRVSTFIRRSLSITHLTREAKLGIVVLAIAERLDGYISYSQVTANLSHCGSYYYMYVEPPVMNISERLRMGYFIRRSKLQRVREDY